MTKGGPLGPGRHRMVGALYTSSLLRRVWRKHAKTQTVMHRSMAKVTERDCLFHTGNLSVRCTDRLALLRAALSGRKEKKTPSMMVLMLAAEGIYPVGAVGAEEVSLAVPGFRRLCLILRA